MLNIIPSYSTSILNIIPIPMIYSRHCDQKGADFKVKLYFIESNETVIIAIINGSMNDLVYFSKSMKLSLVRMGFYLMRREPYATVKYLKLTDKPRRKMKKWNFSCYNGLLGNGLFDSNDTLYDSVQ